MKLNDYPGYFGSDFISWLKSRSDPFLENLPLNFGPYIPIETLRGDENASEFYGLDICRQFRSSGTTSTNRSVSLYSSRGLANYKAASLETFFAVLRRVGIHDPFSMPGISLIPRTADWPDSSLAQMVEWISEFVPVTYASDSDDLPIPERPVWIFGTAFHHILRIDSRKLGKSLHPDSIIFETGGTKGKSRSVTREELYDLCQKYYGCRVVSEYGMCELASQAYDWGEGYRFPYWVRFGVIKGYKDFSTRGRGLLLIDDGARTDFSKPLRTEDVIHINNDGSFALLGRAETAPLKGCSLNVEDLACESRSQAIKEKITIPAETTLIERIKFVEYTLNRFLDDPQTLSGLTFELGSSNAAAQSLADIRKSMPKSEQEWLAAVYKSCNNAPEIARRWFFILPRNHSLVISYPLAFAYILGLKVNVKIPSELYFEHSFAIRYARIFNAHITGTGREFPETDAILCYGSDATVETIRKQNFGFIKTFGSHVAVATIDRNLEPSHFISLAKDVMSTGQRGCLAPRLIIAKYNDDTSLEAIAENLLKASLNFWGGPATEVTRISLEREAKRLADLGFSIYGGKSEDASLVAIKVVSKDKCNSQFFESACAHYPMTLPIILINQKNNKIFNSEIKKIIKNARQSGLALVPEVGLANAPKWDGTHQGTPLFAD